MEGPKADSFVSGFPPPPYYWVDCMHSACIQQQQQHNHHHHHHHHHRQHDPLQQHEPQQQQESEQQQQQQQGSEQQQQEAQQQQQEAQQQQQQQQEAQQQQQQGDEDMEFCRPPPRLPDEYWSVFGVCYSLSPVDVSLDADSSLYTPGVPPKAEFKRLFPLYVDACMQYLNDLATGTDSYSNALRKVIRLHKNLLYLLLLLRQQQQQQEVLQRLQHQLQKRRQATDALKRSLALALQDMQQAMQLANPRDGGETETA